MGGGAQAAMSYVRSCCSRARPRAGRFTKKRRCARSLPGVHPECWTWPERRRTMATSPRARFIKVPVRRGSRDDGGELTSPPRARDADRWVEGEAPRGAPERDLDGHRAARGTRRDLREVPRRVLKATRIVLVDAHGRSPPRGAQRLTDPNQLFGPAARDDDGVPRRRASSSRRPPPVLAVDRQRPSAASARQSTGCEVRGAGACSCERTERAGDRSGDELPCLDQGASVHRVRVLRGG